METVDVAIIGAGPAGATLATLLAGRGRHVALVDREVFPRDKLCGEFLSYDALPLLERLGVAADLDRHGAPAISHCRVVGRRGTYEFEFPRPARGVSRRLLDDLLLRAALDSGARDFTGWTAEAVAPDVTITRGEQRNVLQARVIVGAWGRWGRFDAQLGRRFVRDRARRNFGFKRHYRNRTVTSGAAQTPGGACIDLYSFDRGYLGVSPVEGGITNICGLVHARRLAGLKGGWDAFVDSLRRDERQLDALYAAHEPAQETFLSSDPVIFRPRAPVENGIVMIGDASGIVDPLTGNGMAMAIQSAFVAAPAIERMLANADRAGAEQRYLEAHQAFFSSRIRWSRRIASLLSRPALLETALRAVTTPRAGQFLLTRTRASEEAVARLAGTWF